MARAKRTFILGAGFSKPAGMPLATELLPLLVQRFQHEEMREWLDWLSQRLDWLSENDQQAGSFVLNIEEVFHYAHFDIEVHRLRQHLSPVGRGDGSGTPWNVAESIESWLARLEDALRDVILEYQAQADLAPISRWAETVEARDSVLTFNYDTLVESALSGLGKVWNHGTGGDGEEGVTVCKLHGSIDWIVAHRCETLSKLDLLFDKPNANRRENDTGHVEDDYRLWRCRTPEQLRRWISGAIFSWFPRAHRRGPWASPDSGHTSSCTKSPAWASCGHGGCERCARPTLRWSSGSRCPTSTRWPRCSSPRLPAHAGTLVSR